MPNHWLDWIQLVSVVFSHHVIAVVGYVAAAGHGISAAITGDEDDLFRARRATASSTKSTLVTGGAIGGALVGGPAGRAC